MLDLNPWKCSTLIHNSKCHVPFYLWEPLSKKVLSSIPFCHCYYSVPITQALEMNLLTLHCLCMFDIYKCSYTSSLDSFSTSVKRVEKRRRNSTNTTYIEIKTV